MTFSRLSFFFLLNALLFTSCHLSTPENLEEIFYLRRNGADMPVYVYGNSSSQTFVVVLHGGPGSSGLTYRLGTYSDLLEEQYAMVYWDQRGQGMSQGNYSADRVTISTLTDDLEALLWLLRDRYGSDSRLFLMGHSWGGALGTAFLQDESRQMLCDGWIEVAGAHDFPLLFSEQVPLMDSLAAEQVGLNRDVLFWKSVQEGITRFDGSIPAEDDVLFLNEKANEAETYLVNRGYINDVNAYDQQRLSRNGLLVDNPLTTAFAGRYTSRLLNDELLALSLRAELPDLQLPTLLLWGAYDLVVPVGVGTDALDQIGATDKELVIFPHSGHSPMLAEPEAFAGAIISFINRQ